MGGAENILLQWMESAKRIPNIRMVDIVATAAVPGERFLRDDFEKLADEQFALSNMGINAMSHLELCWHLIQLEQPDVIFIMSNPHFYVLSPLIKKHFPTTKIVDLLHCEDNDDPSWFGTSYEYQQYLDKRIVMSDVWANVLREKYHESADRIIVARQGIDVQTFDPARFDRTALRAMYDIDPSAFVIGFLGRFHDQKNPHVMLQVAKVLRDDPRYHIVMVGGGDHEKDIRKEAKFFKNLTVLPATRNPAAMYAMFDVAVFPSVYEGFPLVGLEAAAMNVPVIATDVTGFREQIGEGKFGVLYEQSFDREKDGRVICDLLKRHADEWKDIGGRGRGFVERGYGVEDMMDQCKTVVGGLLG